MARVPATPAPGCTCIRRRSAAVALSALIAASGCYTSHSRTAYVGAPDLQRAAPTETDQFTYERSTVRCTNHVEGSGATSLYEHRFLELPSEGDNNQPDNQVTASYYRSVVPGSHPLVIVLPIWGTYTYPSRKISRFIQRHSDGRVHVLHVHGERYFVDWDRLDAAPDEESFLEAWREAVEHQRITVIDVRRLLDWAEQLPEIDSEKTALIGFSFAASVAGTILTQESRFAAAVLVMGGSLQHTFLAHCAGERLTAVRGKVARDFGWRLEDFEARLKPLMHEIDAATYPGRVDPEKVFIIDAARDDCMIEECREAMWEALGRPERLTMNYDHRAAFYSITPLGFNWLRYRIWEFLEPRLLE